MLVFYSLGKNKAGRKVGLLGNLDKSRAYLDNSIIDYSKTIISGKHWAGGRVSNLCEWF